jgi:hypothetical protein
VKPRNFLLLLFFPLEDLLSKIFQDHEDSSLLLYSSEFAGPEGMIGMSSLRQAVVDDL